MDRWLYDRWLPPKAREMFAALRRQHEAEVARADRIIKYLEGMQSLHESIRECHDVKRSLTQYFADRAARAKK